ncbi:MAG: tetratricopeptide repeat protein [Chitinophagaceae bacterium]|nr:tetratricopeptide repeat protein [Chitinophagaceae bacterium]
MRSLLTLAGWILITSAYSQATANPDHFANGLKAIEAKNYTQAAEHFKKAAELKPQHGEAWYELGWCYNELARYEDAIKALKNAKIWWKDQAKVYYESGYANDYGGKTDDAIKDYNRCIELSKNYSGAYRQLGNIYFDIDKNYKKALEYYNQYINYSLEKDVTAKTWYKKGYSEIEGNQFEDALTSLKKAVVADDKYAAAYDEMGYAYYKLGKAEDAIVAYTASHQLNPKSSAACNGLGDIYRYLKKNTDEALIWYKKGVEVNPKSQNCQYGAGWCHNEKGRYAEAIPYLKKAIELNDKYTVAYTELGYAYYALKRYDEALAELDKSVRSAETAVAHYYKGLCYIGKKQKEEAQKMYQRLVELKSPDAANLLNKINAM